MQQNIRMVCAFFLTHHLGHDWREGARWFHDTLVDADPAINSMMWQNAGMTGADQWNFSINPIDPKIDPKGDFIRQWIPELAGLPFNDIRAPWTASDRMLNHCGIVLGETYPHPIVPPSMRTLEEE